MFRNVSDSLSPNVPEGWWFQLCCWWPCSQTPFPQTGESQCLLHGVWFSVGREKALVIQPRELRINYRAVHFRAPEVRAKLPTPSLLNSCAICFIFVLLTG